MISFDDRTALVRAGYTASQIAEFDTAAEQPQPVPVPQPQPVPVPQPDPVPQPEPTPIHQPEQPEQPRPADFASMMQSIKNSMEAMVAAMQAQNIKIADMGNPVKETPGDILAKLLNP